MSKMSKFLDILKIAGPGLLLAAGVPAAVVPFVVQAMAVAEASQQPGAEKKKTVMDSIRLGASAFEALGHFPGMTLAVDKGIDATVAAVNAFKAHDVEPVAAGPTP